MIADDSGCDIQDREKMKQLQFAARMVALLFVVILAPGSPMSTAGQAAPDATPASGIPTFSVAPSGEDDLSPFRLTTQAGGAASAILTVSNAGDSPIELKTFPVAVTTAVNGGYTVLPKDDGHHGQIAWLTISAEPYTLEPGQSIDLPFRIVVPDGTAAGEYMAALATETTTARPVAGSGSLLQISRKVNAVVITVAGPAEPGFTLGTPALVAADTGTTVVTPITNTGNVRLYPEGTITISGGAAGAGISIPVKLSSVYAWDTTTIEQTVTPALPAGDYTVTVELRDPATGVSAMTSSSVSLAAEPSATPAS